MILVIVGTNYFPFDRLISYCDLQLAVRYDCYIQLGVSKYLVKNASAKNFFTEEEVADLISRSEWIVCHGGFGIISECLNASKKVLAVPRNKEFHECLDDQHELVDFLDKMHLVKKINDLSDIKKYISGEIDFVPRLDYLAENKKYNRACDIVDNYIDSFIGVVE